MRAEAGFLLRGLLAHVAWYERSLKRRAHTGGTDNARYCYSVWLRHLVKLRQAGFEAPLGCVAELGPGDSAGTGIAALLSGAERYVALDVFPYSNRASWARLLDELVPLFAGRSPIPGPAEFPEIRPCLESYEFPARHVDERGVEPGRVKRLREEMARPDSTCVRYVCPWFSSRQLERASIDVLYSQAVMEHVLDLEGAYRAMYEWLKPGGCASHVVDFRSHGVSGAWNGHWRFPEPLWRFAVSRREFTLNRRPLSHHLDCARRAGFEVYYQKVDERRDGLARRALARPFRNLTEEDLRASGAHLILRKPRIPNAARGYLSPPGT